MVDFIQYSVTGLMNGSIYALLAVAFVIIYKACKIFNFAQGELMLIGGFLSWSLLAQLQLPFWLAMFLTIAFALVLGFAIEWFPLRSMIGQPILSIIMVTLGLSILFRSVVLTSISGHSFVVWFYSVFLVCFFSTAIQDCL